MNAHFVHSSLDDPNFFARRAIFSKMAGKLANSYAAIARQIKRALARAVPPVVLSTTGEAEVEGTEWRMSGNVSVREARQRFEEAVEDQLVAEPFVILHERGKDALRLVRLDQVKCRSLSKVGIGVVRNQPNPSDE